MIRWTGYKLLSAMAGLDGKIAVNSRFVRKIAVEFITIHNPRHAPGNPLIP
jgi:hypothetical protein